MIALAWTGALVGPFVMWWFWRGGDRARRIVAGVLAVFWVLGIWAFLVEPKVTTARHVTVASPAWTSAPLRIAVLSDTHVGDPHVSAERVRRVMARIDREKPDLVVLTGDYVGGHQPYGVRANDERREIERGLVALSEGHAPVVAVLGNHDWWYDGPRVAAVLRRAGVPVLENDAVRLPTRAGYIWVAGVSDLYSQHDPPSVPTALASVPDSEPVILLTHWPDVFGKVPPRVALTVAGHSHCGQVNFPLVGRPLTPSPGARRWPCGLYDEGGRKLLVTGGLGTSILPVRFRAPPEFVIVTLRGRP